MMYNYERISNALDGNAEEGDHIHLWPQIFALAHEKTLSTSRFKSSFFKVLHQIDPEETKHDVRFG